MLAIYLGPSYKPNKAHVGDLYFGRPKLKPNVSILSKIIFVSGYRVLARPQFEKSIYFSELLLRLPMYNYISYTINIRATV